MMKSKIRPLIEVQFDPNVMLGGKQGGYRCWLADRTGLHEAGQTPEGAVRQLHVSIIAHADMKEFAHLPVGISMYIIRRLNPDGGVRFGGPYELDGWHYLEPKATDLVKDARQVNEIVGYLGSQRNH